MKIRNIILLAILFAILSFPQSDNSIVLKFDKKNITLGTSLSDLKKLFPEISLIDSNNNIWIYQLTTEKYNLKLYFNSDDSNVNNLIALEATCFSDQCYFGESSYDVISKQLKNDDRFLHLINDGEGTKTKFYHYPGYLVIDEQYVGLETGDPAFNISLVNLRYLDKWPYNVDYSALYTLSKLMMIFQEEFTDYQLIINFVERVVKNELKENSNVAQSLYNPFTPNPYSILENIYRIKGDYGNLLDILQQFVKHNPNDTIVISNITKYQNILSEDDVNDIEDIETMRIIANKFNGSWKGKYSCNQAEDILFFDVFAKTSGKISANFTFYPSKSNPGGKLGSFTLEGNFMKDGSFVLHAKEWIRKPDDYAMVDINGKIESNYEEIKGIIVHPNCSTFNLIKIDTR